MLVVKKEWENQKKELENQKKELENKKKELENQKKELENQKKELEKIHQEKIESNIKRCKKIWHWKKTIFYRIHICDHIR